jgi:hypothetical protein
LRFNLKEEEIRTRREFGTRNVNRWSSGTLFPC